MLGFFPPNIICAFVGCEWKCHKFQHFVKHIKPPQKSPFLICGMIAECPTVFHCGTDFISLPVNWIVQLNVLQHGAGLHKAWK